MRSILHELYNGHLSPWEQIVSRDPEYLPTHEKIDTIQTYLKKRLSSDDAEMIDQLDSLFCDSSDMHSMATFTYAFKLGSLLTAEVLTRNDELFR